MHIYFYLKIIAFVGKNGDRYKNCLRFEMKEENFRPYFQARVCSEQDEKTIVRLEFEHRKLWRAADHRGGEHVGRRGSGMAEERIASAMHGSRFAVLESLSIVPVERSKEAFSTDTAMHFRDNRIPGTTQIIPSNLDNVFLTLYILADYYCGDTIRFSRYILERRKEFIFP